MFASVQSELARHTEPGGTRDDDDDSWIVAGDNESVDSFLTNCPPSYMEKSWISAQHDGMTKLVEDFYTSTTAEGAYGRDNMEEIKAAWEENETKTLETLIATLKEHKYGCGKWMIFVTASDVDSIWRKVVTALWGGKLGHSAKVSGNTPECNGSHVINVYVDPFWETAEVERVLAALRELCGVHDAIKYKADGVTQLGLYKGNEFGIPPSFYAANRNSSSLSVQKASTPPRPAAPRPGRVRRARRRHFPPLPTPAPPPPALPAPAPLTPPGMRASARWPQSSTPGKEWKGSSERGADAPESSRSTTNDKWNNTRSNTWVKREAPRSAPKPVVAEKKKDVKKVSAFAALAGVEDDDAEAILAKKKEKREKKKKKAAEKEADRVESSELAFEKLKAGLKVCMPLSTPFL